MISGVILAAGESKRLGRPKQLLPLGGQPLLAHVLLNAASSDLDEVILVLGYEAERIAAAVGEWGQRLVVNPDYAAGQSTSLRAGLAAINPGSDAVLFLLGDQPQVGPATINALISAYRTTGGPIVAAQYGGAIANPVLFARSLFPELAQVMGDQGARMIVRTRQGEVVAVAAGEAEPPRDVDTEEDFNALLAAWRPGD